jgi:hypothetical protein
MLSDEENRRFQARWEDVQAAFVSDPRTALERADALVADAVERLQARYAEERRALKGRWEPDQTPTESLRTSLQMYRGLLDSLLP